MQTADKGTVCRGLPLPAPRARSRAGQLPLQITLPQLQGSPAVPHCTRSALCDQRCCFASPLHLKRQNSSSFSLLPFFFSPTKTNLPGVHLSLNYFLFLMLKAYAVQLLSCWDANSFFSISFSEVAFSGGNSPNGTKKLCGTESMSIRNRTALVKPEVALPSFPIKLRINLPTGKVTAKFPSAHVLCIR